jgi:hypothetical protein
VNTANASGRHLAAHYTFRQLEELWIAAGGNRIEAPIMAAIALAESSGNPFAENHNQNGTVDRGLWQINSVHGSLSTTNIAANAKAAVQVRKAEGLGAWVTFKSGAYKQYLTPSNLRSGIKQGEAPQTNFLQDPIEETGNAAAKAGKGIIEAGNAAENVGKEIGEGVNNALGAMWGKFGLLGVNIVLLLAGAVLFVYGVMVAVKPRGQALSLPVPVPV